MTQKRYEMLCKIQICTDRQELIVHFRSVDMYLVLQVLPLRQNFRLQLRESFVDRCLHIALVDLFDPLRIRYRVRWARPIHASSHDIHELQGCQPAADRPRRLARSIRRGFTLRLRLLFL